MPAVRLNQKVAVAIVFVSAMFMNIMDITIVNVALPTIGRDFNIPPTAVDGVVIAYLVSLAVFIPASGWLGDRFGGKRVLITAIVVFTVGSVLCGVAQNITELILFRVVQGAGGGMLAPVGLAMLFRVFPPAERIRASSILTVPTTVAPAVGPVLGGFLVTDLSWRWVFFVNLPLGIAAVTFGLLCLERSEPLDAGRFDRPGFLLGGAGLGLLMYGISEGPLMGWSSPAVLGACFAGALLLTAMVLVELRVTRPLVDLRLLKDRLFRSTNGVMFLASAAFLGTLYLIPLYFQDARGLSALQSGLSTFPEAFGVMAGAQLASRLDLPEIGPASPHHLRAPWTHPDDVVAHADQRDDQFVAHPGRHVRIGADDGAGLRAHPGRLLCQDLASQYRAGLDLLQHHAPGRERRRRGHSLHRPHRHWVDPRGWGWRATEHAGLPLGLRHRRHFRHRRGGVLAHHP